MLSFEDYLKTACKIKPILEHKQKYYILIVKLSIKGEGNQ